MPSDSDSKIKIPSLEDIEQLKKTSSTPKTILFKANQLQNNTPSTIAAQGNSIQRESIPVVQGDPAQKKTSEVNNKRSGGSAILVNPTQQKNPVLKFIRNIPYEPSEGLKMDYVVGLTTGVIYLSLRYHRLYPTYIYERLNSVKGMFVTRILLVYVDTDSHHDAVKEINRIAILSDFTLVLCWSLEEAARYLESFKAFENSGADLIREKVENDYLTKMTDCLTNIRSVNKTDVLTLLSNFGSLKNIIEAPTEDISLCPGFGEQKVKRIQNVWKQPFLINKKKI